MAVEIIKRGVVRVKGWRGTCQECKTEVFFLTEDAKSTYSCQKDGGHATLDCPVCSDTLFGYPHTKSDVQPPRIP